MKKEYSLSFIFSENLSLVWLIRKNKPDWQRGFFNGVGGKFEENEDILDCTIREVEEECGLKIFDWTNVGTFESDEWKVYITTTKLLPNQFMKAEQKTDELIKVFDVEYILSDDSILKSTKTAIAASLQKLTDPNMGEINVNYF